MSRFGSFSTSSLLLGTLAASGCIVQVPADAPTQPAPRVADPQITRCADWRQRDPGAGDGDYPIYAQGRPVTVYCHDMAGQPREYLSVRQTGDGANSSAYGVGPNTSPEGLVTSYTRVRLDPAALALDPKDATFASSNGGSKHFGPSVFHVQEYGTASDCVADRSQTGRASIDLRGTPFGVVADQFVANGWNPAGTASYSESSQVVTLTGGGYCGSMEASSGQILLGFVDGTSGRDQVVDHRGAGVAPR